MDVAFSELTGGLAARQLQLLSRVAAETPEPGAEPDDAAGAGDTIALSAAAEAALTGDSPEDGNDARSDAKADKADKTDAEKPAEPGAQRGADGEPLDDAEQREVERLADRDREVRTHEQAHQAAGGPHAGSPSYDYETGPDGKQYATSGEVPIDTAAIADDPQATIAKMEVVKRAALAPAEPSSADRAIAAKADQTKVKAQQELRQQEAAATGPAAATDPATGTDDTLLRFGDDDGIAPPGHEHRPPPGYTGRGSLLSLTA